MQFLQNSLENSQLQTIIQFNPYDAVIVMGLDQNQQYFVELINSKAAVLFKKSVKKRIEASTFFNEVNWKKIKQCITQVNGGSHYILLDNGIQTIAQVLPYHYNGATYYCMIMRYTSNEQDEHYAVHVEKAKHLHFVEQYIEPVVTIDLNGTIVYSNKKAIKKFGQVDKISGKKFNELIDETSTELIDTILKTTFEGNITAGVRMHLKKSLFHNEIVTVSSFPTYWEGKIIGAHLIIKSIENGSNYREPIFPAYEDELSSLLNRRALNERWNEYVLSFPELNTAFLLVDIDRFRRFNESLGKHKADQMLAEISARFYLLRNEFCEVFRYNGDEFVFLIKYNSLEEVENLANNILYVLKTPFIVDEQEYFVTASIGISTVGSKGLAVLEKMLHQADQALFHVKVNGRAHYRFYNKEMSLTFPNEALMEAHLKCAIEYDELSIVLQPQINLETKTIDSFEALMRWKNRKFGLVPPSQFIPLAESSGLIIHIGDWILEQVLAYQADWKKSGYRPVRVAVNISPNQLKHEGFVERVKELLTKYDVDPHYLELEITEGSMLNVDETAKILDGLKELGVFVSVDDFGTGYSSLSYLMTYPIDIIKIDQSFISDMSKGKKNEALVKAIISLSQNLGMEVIAEGVENREQEKFLFENNCNKVQGYLYAKPLPIEQVVEKYLA